MRKTSKISKGKYGYIDKRKKDQIIKSALLFLAVIVVYLTGYFLNDHSKNNVFTIIAILLVLPAAKVLSSAIIILPYKTIEKEKFDEVTRLMTREMTMLTDLVITSPEKIMNLSFLILVNGNAFGLIGSKGADAHYAQNYIYRSLKNNGSTYNVKIFTDYKVFLNKIQSLEGSIVEHLVDKNTISYLLTLNV